MKIKLKPCPFCGASVAVIVSARAEEICKHYDDTACPYFEAAGHWCDSFIAVCDIHAGGCGAATGVYASGDEAAAAWNGRA